MNRYYATLGLPTTASKDEIRRKYRQLVLKWHPDRNSSPEAHTKFIAITEAYDILMGERPAPRATYTYAKAPASKPVKQQQYATKAELMRRKFENIRTKHLSARDANARKQKMYATAQNYFVGAAVAGVAIIAIPLVLGSFAHLIWTLPLGFAAGALLLWNGGRYKVRADMIFGPQKYFTDEEINEFFVDSPGSVTPQGDADYWS